MSVYAYIRPQFGHVFSGKTKGTIMTEYSQHYEENLYPIQNGVLNIVEKCNVPFYLTGGTALGRGYFNHRYSDDLDFFVNSDINFADNVDTVLRELAKKEYIIDNSIIREIDYVSIYISEISGQSKLKIDFVNDAVPHFGNLQKTPVFSKTDNLDNILSNKITALFRYSAKDVVDIREICLQHSFQWKSIFDQVDKKELGIDLPIIAEILEGMPQKEFDGIFWIKKPSWQKFKEDISQIANDMLTCTKNSLHIERKRKSQTWDLSR